MGVCISTLDIPILLMQVPSDWFRQETEHDSLQPIMDFLLNVSVFIWLGAVCPWDKFLSNESIPSYRLILLGVLVLLLRRLPVIIALRKQIPQIRHFRHALIMGFFGPIGVSAIFYLYVTLEFLHKIQVDNPAREDCAALAEVTLIAVWFLVVSSVVSESHRAITLVT
jgi:NhaP-type Na+/H+ or K+/H+ antiporter